ncbi:phenylacetate--CoA ligase family protein [Polaribacter uvawellassae]|uniref:phenylacetate--CoA ligase family protein n=1 Tax=Polaribacter uvawellassae TaxID=3133495 RepID=UPI00321BCB94
MHKVINTIFFKLPILLQNGLISLYGYYWKNRRLGKVFKNEIKFWKDRENFTKEDWKLHQTKGLRALLIHAFTTVPFYRELYSEKGFTLKDFENFELTDLHKLPYLEKEALRKYGDTTLLSEKKKKGKFYSSSGSTGTPVKIFITKEFHQKWNAAYEVRVRNWAGVNYRMARGMIGGRKVVKNATSKAPFYRYNLAEKQTYFSAYHISDKNLLNYYNAINKNKIDYMVGYAMSNYFLADLIVKRKLPPLNLKAVLTSSEKLTTEMRETFQKAYNCKTFDAYSGVEACGLISENLDGDFLLSPDTGIMELIDKNGNQVNFGEEGEIISTGLLNFDQPLIRYRIGDKAKLSKNQQTKSGLEMPKFDEISGRVEDTVTTKDGKKIVRFHSLFIDIDGLLAAQVIQEKIDCFRINLITTSSFNKKDETEIEKKIKNQLGNIQLIFEYLDQIPKNKNGKFQAVISKINFNE